MKQALAGTGRQDWDLSAFFPEFGGPAHLDFKRQLSAELAEMQATVKALDRLDSGSAAAWTVAVLRFEALAVKVSHLRTWLHCLGYAEAENDAVTAEISSGAVLDAEITKLRTLFLRSFAGAEESVFAAFCQDEQLQPVAHALRRMRNEGRCQMPAEQESLAADLAVDGIGAWGRLYDTLSGRLSFDMTFPDGSQRRVPMSERRSLMANDDRRIREAAFHEGQKPWLAHEDTLAAALNALAGTRHTLATRRGWTHFLDPSLHDAAVSRETVEAMFSAILANLELPRQALRLTAKKQGTAGLAFFDLEASHWLLPDAKPVAWPDACSLVDGAFSSAYPALGAYFRQMLELRWIESERRPGKRPGAFMTESALINEERIYGVHMDTLHDVVTLAHETGHAWHSRLLRDLRPMARNYPMTLAETASNFGEQILIQSLLKNPGLGSAEKAHLLDQQLIRATSNLLNITMRFEFEHRFYEQRKAGELSASRFKELMTAAQRKIYGDTLLPGGCDPMFWAVKPHFFIVDVAFYNFPYVFGYLLSQALYAQFEREGPDFLPKYEAFLRRTGSATCEDCVRETLGRDIRQPAFWEEGILAMAGPLEELERLS